MISDRYKKSNALLSRALKVIPLGSQTFSKSISNYPQGVSPLFINRGKGAHVWDVDGNEYIDFNNALASVLIGYCDEDINRSVTAQLNDGLLFPLPHPLEMEVAEKLVDFIPCAEMVRFGKNGSDATSAAIRLSRAYTGRDHVAVCGYHGWHDWYIGSTARDMGVPGVVKQLTHRFEYNNINSLNEIFERNVDNIAAVILEPMNAIWPENDFLVDVIELSHKHNAVVIFDEMITGFRFSRGGAQEFFNVVPDLSTFGKGIGNGFPFSAVVGRKEIMCLMEDIFFSGTFAGEALSLCSVKAVLDKIEMGNVVQKIADMGELLTEGVQKHIRSSGLDSVLSISGHPSWTFLNINETEALSSWEIKTFLLQEVFKRGILFTGTHNISYAHTQSDINALLQVYEEVFSMLSVALKEGSLLEKLDASPIRPLFKVRS